MPCRPCASPKRVLCSSRFPWRRLASAGSDADSFHAFLTCGRMPHSLHSGHSVHSVHCVLFAAFHLAIPQSRSFASFTARSKTSAHVEGFIQKTQAQSCLRRPKFPRLTRQVYQWPSPSKGTGVKDIGPRPTCAACILRKAPKPAADTRGLTPDA